MHAGGHWTDPCPPPPIPLKFIKERERERDQFNMKNNKLNFLKNRFPGMMINKL